MRVYSKISLIFMQIELHETHFFSFTFYNGYNAIWQLIDYSAKIFNQPVILTSIENSYFTVPMLFN